MKSYKQNSQRRDEMPEPIELTPDTGRQAKNIFRGYVYQAYQTVCAWLKCNSGEEILAEFAEDMDLVRRDLDGNVTDAQLNQIKHEKGTVTLNSKVAVDLINNFFCHKKRNPDINIFVRLCTISDRGKERHIDWQYADCGMDLWDRLKERQLNQDEQNKAVHILRSFLLSNKELSEDARSFIRGSDDLTILNMFIKHISWDTGQQSYGEIENEIKRLLANRHRPVTDQEEVRQVIDRLWRHVTDVIAAESTKTLTREDLERLLAQETSVVVDRRTIKEMYSGIRKIEKSNSLIEAEIEILLQRFIPAETTVELNYPVTAFLQNLPPLPRICCPRPEVVQTIKDKNDHHLVTWIHGSTGYGKTILANLLVRGQSVHCHWFGLREVAGFSLISSLQMILSFLKHFEKNGILLVFDDLKIEKQHTYCIELLHAISNSLLEKNSKLLVTSQFEPPERLKALLDGDMCSFDAPEMSTSEISMLIEMAGITNKKENEFWSNYIYAATSGHPQLVIAYFTYLRDKEWRFASIDEFLGKPRPVEQVKAESRKLLAQTIKSEEARELARRLSVIVGMFERQFAIDVAFAPPCLKEPGAAFDTLVGPWVEEVENDLYVLSPLLGGYAEAEFGQGNLKTYYGIVSYAWLRKKTLNTLQIIQAITAGIIAGVEPLVAKICRCILLADPEKINPIAKELSIIPLFGIERVDSLADMDPIVRSMFRRLQLKICEYNADWSTYSRIDDLVARELNEIKSHPLYEEIYMVHCVDTSIRIDSPLKPKERIDRALSVLQMAFEKRDTKKDGIIWNQPLLGEVLMVATHNISSLDDLGYLFDKLEQQPVEIVAKVMAGFETLSESLELLIDRVWLSESERQPPDWVTCEKVFLKAMDFGRKRKHNWLMAAVARGRMVVFDEYLNDPEMALKVAQEARAAIGKNHPLIDLGESTVFYRQGKHNKVIEIINNLEESLPSNILIHTRIFGINRAVRSAANIDKWDKAKEFANFGKKLSTSIDDKNLSEVLRIAFDAEMCLTEHFMGNFGEASILFQKVLEDLEKYPDQEYQQFRVLRLKFGAAAAWASHALGSESSSDKKSESHPAKPFIGLFSNIEELPEEIMKRPAPVYPLTWSMVAMYAAWAGQQQVAEACAKRAMVETGQGQFYLAVQKAWEALFASHLNAREFDLALHSGLEYARLFIMGSECLKKGGTWDPMKPMDLKTKAKDLEPILTQESAESVTSLVLEPIFMALCSAEESPKIDFPKWVDNIELVFGRGNDFVSILSWVETVVLATFGDQTATDRVKEGMGDSSKTLGRLPMLACSVSRMLPLNDVLSAQSSLLLGIAVPFHGSMWTTVFCRMVAKRWIYLVEHQRFMLASPVLSAPEILKLASLPNPNLSDCANLLLIVAAAINTRWLDEVANKLRDLAKSG